MMGIQQRCLCARSQWLCHIKPELSVAIVIHISIRGYVPIWKWIWRLQVEEWCNYTEVHQDPTCTRCPRVRKNEGGEQTCQLVSPGSPEICMRCGVRLGRGAVPEPRSLGVKLVSRGREPRANWTVRRSPRSSEPSIYPVRRCLGGNAVGSPGLSKTYGKLAKLLAHAQSGKSGRWQHTWDDVTGIHWILVLNEAKAVHDLDLLNNSGAVSGEVVLDIFLGSCTPQRQLRFAFVKLLLFAAKLLMILF